jgi:hypothetical protein
LGELTRLLIEKKIAKFKLPERLEIVDAFPLTGVGKVSKKDLREPIAAALKAEQERGRNGVAIFGATPRRTARSRNGAARACPASMSYASEHRSIGASE